MNGKFKDAPIDGVVVKPVKRHLDKRGWLSEMFRCDELEPQYRPVMGYISLSNPGVTRGPHEHVDQADLFVFPGPGTFHIYAWDNRPSSPTYGNRMRIEAGEGSPASVLVPAGVVHAYRNVSAVPAMVHNYPNQLFAGEGRKQPIDEIRHEDDPESPFRLE